MIRPFTFVTMMLAAGSGLYLYQTKHQAQVLDREIARTMKTADTVRQRAGLMRAEYALLNDPARLAELSGQWLPELRNTAPAQYASWSDFDRRLPAIGAPPPPAPLEPQAPDAMLPKAAPAKGEPAKGEPAKVEPARIEPARPEPPKIETTRTELPKPPIVVTTQPRAPVAAPLAPAPIQHASMAVRPAAPLPQPRPIASAATPNIQPTSPPAPVLASVPPPVPLHTGRSMLAVAANMPATPPAAARPRPEPSQAAAPPTTPAEAIARIVRGGPVDPSVPAVASALGMARTMVPSASPISPAQAASVGQR